MANHNWAVLGLQVRNYPPSIDPQLILNDLKGLNLNSIHPSWSESNGWSDLTLAQVTYALSPAIQSDPILFPSGS
jgi:hypothetical protein